MAKHEEWGVGDQGSSKAFEQGALGDGTKYDLIFGEHPHGRDDDNIYARFEDGSVEGFDGHRVQVEVSIKTNNYLKMSGMSGNEVRKGGLAEISFDGDVVYTTFFRDVLDVLIRLRSTITKLIEFPIDWKRASQEGSKELVGRLIYYRNTPAVVTDWWPDQGCIMVEAVPGQMFPKMCWEEEGDTDRRRIKDDIFSAHIWWFRKERKSSGSVAE